MNLLTDYDPIIIILGSTYLTKVCVDPHIELHQVREQQASGVQSGPLSGKVEQQGQLSSSAALLGRLHMGYHTVGEVSLLGGKGVAAFQPSATVEN